MPSADAELNIATMTLMIKYVGYKNDVQLASNTHPLNAIGFVVVVSASVIDVRAGANVVLC